MTTAGTAATPVEPFGLPTPATQVTEVAVALEHARAYLAAGGRWSLNLSQYVDEWLDFANRLEPLRTSEDH